jgi:hypothetical protein
MASITESSVDPLATDESGRPLDDTFSSVRIQRNSPIEVIVDKAAA